MGLCMEASQMRPDLNGILQSKACIKLSYAASYRYTDVTSILPSNSTTTLTQQQTSLPNITNAVSHTIVQQVMPQTMTSVAYPYNTQTEVNLPDSTISPPTQDNSSIHHK
ncbi:hypothetical protein CVS40_12709 [Lucilia cuprina]|nr:hypothetical protein CVS40_12709 [Lucilia cuprina]